MLTAIKTVPIDNRVVAGSSPAVGVASDVAQLVERVTPQKHLDKKGLHIVETLSFTGFYI